VANSRGYEGEILWDTSKPDGTPKNTTRRQAKLAAARLEARNSRPKAAPDTAQALP